MKLYHGSNFRLTDLTVRKGDLFNGMFFSSDMESAQGPGASHYYYSTEIDEDDIAELTKPESKFTSTSRKDIYNDWFDSISEAREFAKSAREA